MGNGRLLTVFFFIFLRRILFIEMFILHIDVYISCLSRSSLFVIKKGGVKKIFDTGDYNLGLFL